MCGSACNEESVFLTSSTSSSRWKESAAVLFLPRTSASAVMSSIIARRDVTISVAIIARPANSSTAVQVKRMIIVNLRLIDFFVNDSIALLPALSRIGIDDLRALEQLRADFESAALRGIGIYLKADLVVLDVEIDDAAARSKPAHFADGNDVCVVQTGHGFRQVVLFRCADEHQMARLEVLDLPRPFDHQFPPLDRFVLKGLFQRLPKRII